MGSTALLPTRTSVSMNNSRLCRQRSAKSIPRSRLSMFHQSLLHLPIFHHLFRLLPPHHPCSSPLSHHAAHLRRCPPKLPECFLLAQPHSVSNHPLKGALSVNTHSSLEESVFCLSPQGASLLLAYVNSSNLAKNLHTGPQNFVGGMW